MTGAQATCAAMGTAATRARPEVNTRARYAARMGDHRAMEAVASTERANP